MLFLLGLFLFIALLLVSVIFVLSSFYLINQAEVVVIERLGKFSRVLSPGLHLVTPFLERPRRVLWSYVIETDNKRHQRITRSFDRLDLRESVYDFPRQNVITKDNVTMEINALLYYQITDPKAAVYEIDNLPQAIEQLTQTTLRDVVGSLTLDETLTSRSQINDRLRIILDEATDKWGVKVNRVELKEINPPADIRHAMEKEMRAERDRRAIILEAEGIKQSAILQAEGARESLVLRARGEADSKILQAEGEAQARLKIALAEAQAIEMITRVVPAGDPMPYLVAMRYIGVLPELMQGKDNKMIVIPYEASSLTGSLAMIKKLFDEVK
jgi:regulator of protease activity HflC (stomatin/prohibitin superfamily)